MGNNQKKTVLIVDDDPGILDALSMLLEEFEYKVMKAADGSFISALSEGTLPDLILLDIWISGWDGRELCRRLKTLPLTAHVPVLLISAHKDIEPIAKEAMADGYVAKPFEIEVLIDQIESALERTRGEAKTTSR